jgi:hypothetical protein
MEEYIKGKKTIYYLTQLNKKAQKWIKRNEKTPNWVEDSQVLQVKLLHIRDLIEGMEQAGLIEGKDFKLI